MAIHLTTDASLTAASDGVFLLSYHNYNLMLVHAANYKFAGA